MSKGVLDPSSFWKKAAEDKAKESQLNNSSFADSSIFSAETAQSMLVDSPLTTRLNRISMMTTDEPKEKEESSESLEDVGERISPAKRKTPTATPSKSTDRPTGSAKPTVSATPGAKKASVLTSGPSTTKTRTSRVFSFANTSIDSSDKEDTRRIAKPKALDEEEYDEEDVEEERTRRRVSRKAKESSAVHDSTAETISRDLKGDDVASPPPPPLPSSSSRGISIASRPSHVSRSVNTSVASSKGPTSTSLHRSIADTSASIASKSNWESSSAMSDNTVLSDEEEDLFESVSLSTTNNSISTNRSSAQGNGRGSKFDAKTTRDSPASMTSPSLTSNNKSSATPAKKATTTSKNPSWILGADEEGAEQEEEEEEEEEEEGDDGGVEASRRGKRGTAAAAGDFGDADPPSRFSLPSPYQFDIDVGAMAGGPDSDSEDDHRRGGGGFSAGTPSPLRSESDGIGIGAATPMSLTSVATPSSTSSSQAGRRFTRSASTKKKHQQQNNLEDYDGDDGDRIEDEDYRPDGGGVGSSRPGSGGDGPTNTAATAATGSSGDGVFAVPSAPAPRTRPMREARNKQPLYVFEEVKTPRVEGKAVRKRIPRLDHHRNERIVYGLSPSSSMPSILGVIKNYSEEEEGKRKYLEPDIVPMIPKMAVLTVLPKDGEGADGAAAAEGDDSSSSEPTPVNRTITIPQPEYSPIGGNSGRKRKRGGQGEVLEDPLFDGSAEMEMEELEEGGVGGGAATRPPRAEIAEAFGCVSGWLRIARNSEQYFNADPVQSKLFFVARGHVILTIGEQSTRLPPLGCFVVPPHNEFTLAHGSASNQHAYLSFIALPGDQFPTAEYK